VNRAGFSWWEAWGPVAHLGFQKGGESLPSNYGVLKIEGLGGRPPVSGRPGAQGSPAPLNPALHVNIHKTKTPIKHTRITLALHADINSAIMQKLSNAQPSTR